MTLKSEIEPSAVARAIARRMVEPAAVSLQNGPASSEQALRQICERVLENLRDAMGGDGCDALFARALARVKRSHPLLMKLHRQNGNALHLDGLSGSIEAYGRAGVVAAIEALLTALADILGRLIGEDMAARLIEQNDGDGDEGRHGERISGYRGITPPIATRVEGRAREA